MTEETERHEQLLRLLWDLNITNAEAIRLCKISPRTFYRWLAGDTPVPYTAIRMFELMLALKPPKA